MEIKVLGTGCAGCVALYETVNKVVEELSIEAKVVKEQDIMRIMEYNVMSLPGLVIDGKVVSAGKRLSANEVKALLNR
ncbi:MAG: thioredoxin family protein [Bacteroidaceae bacterium]